MYERSSFNKPLKGSIACYALMSVDDLYCIAKDNIKNGKDKKTSTKLHNKLTMYIRIVHVP